MSRSCTPPLYLMNDEAISGGESESELTPPIGEKDKKSVHIGSWAYDRDNESMYSDQYDEPSVDDGREYGAQRVSVSVPADPTVEVESRKSEPRPRTPVGRRPRSPSPKRHNGDEHERASRFGRKGNGPNFYQRDGDYGDNRQRDGGHRQNTAQWRKAKRLRSRSVHDSVGQRPTAE